MLQSERAMKYCLLHLGCQMNRSDAERVRTVIEGLGYDRTDDERDADLLGIVACSVRQRAIDKAYARIRLWNSWKSAKSLLTFVTGCVLPADREKFLTLFDLVFDITEAPQLPDMIRQYGVVTGVGMDTVIPRDSLQDAATGYWRIRPSYTLGLRGVRAHPERMRQVLHFLRGPVHARTGSLAPLGGNPPGSGRPCGKRLQVNHAARTKRQLLWPGQDGTGNQLRRAPAQ